MPISYERPDRRQEELNLIGKTQEKMFLPGKHKRVGVEIFLPGKTVREISLPPPPWWGKTNKCIWSCLLSLALIGQNLTIVTVH